MEEKFKLSVPTNEGQNVVGEEELKTITENPLTSGSTPTGSITMDSAPITDSLSVGNYSWPVSGTVSWAVSCYFDASQPGLGPGSSEVIVNVNWANVMLNVIPHTTVIPLPENKTKVISYTGISSPYFNLNLGSSIQATASNVHFQVSETIYNEDHEIESNRSLLDSTNVSIKVELKFEYDYFLQSPRMNWEGIKISTEEL